VGGRVAKTGILIADRGGCKSVLKGVSLQRLFKHESQRERALGKEEKSKRTHSGSLKLNGKLSGTQSGDPLVKMLLAGKETTTGPNHMGEGGATQAKKKGETRP